MSDEFLAGIESNWLGTLIRDIAWMFPALEVVHFMGLCVLFGSLMVIDLRLLGIAKFIPYRPAMAFIPIAIAAFSVNMLSGIGFFCADPFRYYPNIAFRWKIFFIILAGLNALYFNFVEHKKLRLLAEGADTDLTVKFVAGLSLILWVCVIVMGRMIPYLE